MLSHDRSVQSSYGGKPTCNPSNLAGLKLQNYASPTDLVKAAELSFSCYRLYIPDTNPSFLRCVVNTSSQITACLFIFFMMVVEVINFNAVKFFNSFEGWHFFHFL